MNSKQLKKLAKKFLKICVIVMYKSLVKKQKKIKEGKGSDGQHQEN